MPQKPAILQEKLRCALSLRGWSQSRLADEIGVSRQTFSNYMTGSTPKPATLVAISRCLRVDLQWLCDEEDVRTDPVTTESRMALADASDEELYVESQRRFNSYTDQLASMVELAKFYRWNAAAVILLSNEDREVPPDWVVDIMRFAFDMDYIHSYLDGAANCVAMERHYWLHVKRMRNETYDSEKARLSKTEFWSRRLGCEAISDYLVFSRIDLDSGTILDAPRSRIPADLVERFWSRVAPTYLARLVVKGDIPEEVNADTLRKTLVERGFLDSDHVPSELHSSDVDGLLGEAYEVIQSRRAVRGEDDRND